MSRSTQTIFGMPGVVLPFAGSAAPAGWLLCHGQAVSRTTYAHLLTVIGTAYGVGDGSTTFNVPDLRGEFVRGVDAGAGVDAGRVLGSKQLASTVRTNGTDSASDATWVRPTGVVVNPDAITTVSGQRLMIMKTQTDLETADLWENSVRPRNIALNHIIKT